MKGAPHVRAPYTREQCERAYHAGEFYGGDVLMWEASERRSITVTRPANVARYTIAQHFAQTDVILTWEV